MKKQKTNRGITLIALVVTIIVLLILAGVSISMLVGEGGILTYARLAKEQTEEASKREQEHMDQYLDEMGAFPTNGEYVEDKGVNSPDLLNGMTKIMFTEPTEDEKGKIIKSGEEGFDYQNWYDYKKGNWANSMTEDGSMWVWIPRYAYKINDNKTFDIKFLIGTSDEYYDESGEKQKAKRASSEEIADTQSEYYVHPAFTDESNINYANGGWDEELKGIWVAKFEAGYASGNNDAKVKETSLTYSQNTIWVGATELGGTSDGNGKARNWLDGIYNTTPTKIKYPTFQGITYSMNYINHNDSFNLAKELTANGNIYGLSSSTTDSHLMKNSEWGAVAYLSQSEYGLNGKNIYINNITLNSGNAKREDTDSNKAEDSGVASVYAVTGLTQGGEDTGSKTVTSGEDTINKINEATGNTPVDGIYRWDQKKGQGASSTGTIYGIYDLSGGLWERTAAYTANGWTQLKSYGKSLAYDGDIMREQSTKYTMVYPHDSEKDKTGIESNDNNLNEASQANYKLNTKIYGDAIRETSTGGTGSSSRNKDSSYFVGLSSPFSLRGGSWTYGAGAGLFCFNRNNGSSNFSHRLPSGAGRLVAL